MLKYQYMRASIVAGDLIAFSHTGWRSISDVESQIVRMVTRSEYSHVGIAWPVAGRVLILEAVVPEIRIFPLSKLLPFFHISSSITSWTQGAEDYALSRVGQRYSKWEAIKGFLGTNRDDRRWQCAEYARQVLRAAGLPLDCRDTPTDLVAAMLRQPGTTYNLVRG